MNSFAFSEHTSFNSRLQPVQVGLGTLSDSSKLQLDYGYGATSSNNGNVMSQTITVPNPSGGSPIAMSQSYSYDGVNRIGLAQETTGSNPPFASWSETFNYDQYGNMWVTNPTGITLSPLTPQSQNAFTAATNRLAASLYDFAGNQTVDAQNRTFGYDAENHQINFNGGAATYVYDGEGHRVKKIDGTATTVFVYNAGSQLIAEYTTGTPTGGDTSYLTTDHLGSTRLVTDSGGNVKARYDYLPFGGEIGANLGPRTGVMGYGGADSTRQKFTQKERDIESGLDYFGARYYSSAQGRFSSPDLLEQSMLSAKKRDIYIANPQRWDRYAFVLNNPLRFVDPDGLVDIADWSGLSKDVQTDLMKHNITKELWDSWSNDQRQQVMNFRARMMAASLWDDLDQVMFVRPDSDGKTTKVTVEPEAWKNFLLAFTIKKSALDEGDYFDHFRGRLDKAGITRDTFFKHKEAAWSNHEGSEISIHILGFKAPSDTIAEVHFDAGGGNWYNVEHIIDASTGSGPTADRVTGALGTDKWAAPYLRGFGTQVDRLVVEAKEAAQRAKQHEPVK